MIKSLAFNLTNQQSPKVLEYYLLIFEKKKGTATPCMYLTTSYNNLHRSTIMVALRKIVLWLLAGNAMASNQTPNKFNCFVQAPSSLQVMEFQKYITAWTNDVVDSFKKQGITLQEIEVKADPDMPIALKEEAEKENTKAYKTTWEELPAIIKGWIKAHPYQTAFHVVNGVVFFCPAAASGPVLYLLGFGSLGPRAASFASFLQSKFGVVAAKSGFAYMQSAGMGGYGVGTINIASQLSAAVGSLSTWLWRWFSGNGTGGAGDDE
ncbi:hypothetical protein DSL72_005946 [Monilinia vaccinii-corymbosi]|uniref:Uncharacterized protein n=1 Tax=Monilinia vaccinii-corymbosi TaxID=61207 RepID=A0A8A3PH38_9HELO|nr:hypothetical protein DSL72_005946 [Monilinia vaccinii-corymbosi]